MNSLNEAERAILTSIVSSDAVEAVTAWEQWKQLWRLLSPEGWRAAPQEQLGLVAPAWTRVQGTGFRDTDSDLLDGIVRATWVASMRQLHLAAPSLEKLQRRVGCVILKGSALIARGNLGMSVRRLSDIDILIREDSVPAALSCLRDLGFSPLYGCSYESIAVRLATRRDGWNFQGSTGAQIDLHWRTGGPVSSSFSPDDDVWSDVEPRTLVGVRVRVPNPAFLVAYAVLHSFVRGTPRDRLQSLVDVHSLMPQCSVQDALAWGERLGVKLQVGQAISLLFELSNSPDLSTIAEWQPEYPNPPQEPWNLRPETEGLLSRVRRARQSREFKHRSDSRLIRGRLRYRLWEYLGRLPTIERLFLCFGPLSRLITPSRHNTEFDFSSPTAVDRVAGPGWAWTDPTDKGTWTDRADARLLIQVPRKTRGKVVISLAEAWNRPFNLDGNFSGNPRGSLFVNGRLSQRYDVWDSTQTNPIVIRFNSRRRTWIEVSIRPDASPDPRKLPPVYDGWKRSLLVGHVEVHVDSVS